MRNTQHKKISQWMRFLALALILALLCPAGVLAQDSLTVAVQTAGNQVTLQGTTSPVSVVTVMVTKTLNGDKSYIDQFSSTSQGTYQVVFQLANGDYKVKVSSNGMQQEKTFTVGQSSLLTPPVLSADSIDNTLGKEVDLTFTEDLVWRDAITSITVDGTVLSAGQYTITEGKLRLLAGVLTTVGSHTIAIIATGYDNATVTQNLEALPTDLGTVKVRVVDNVQRLANEVDSLDANYKEPFGEILPPTDVAITEGLTMKGALDKALATKSMRTYGAANYVSGIGPVTSADGTRTVDKLSEFNAGAQSGWMVTINDWFINAGVNSFVVKDGDVVEFCYTCNLGIDVDGDFNNPTTTLKSLSSSAGTFSPAFTPATKNYTLTLPAASKIIVNPTAANRTNQVSIQSGNNTYRKTDEIVVEDKQVITVTCAQNIYKITIAIVEDNPDQDRADEVSTLIGALPAVDQIELADKAQIEAARAAYVALSEVQKELVTNLAKLTAAEAKLAELQGGGEDTTPPVITLKDSGDQTLTEDLTVTNPSFSFKATAQDAKDGLLSPSVQLNGTALAAGIDGSYICTLSMGSNTITVTATDAAGNKAEKSLKIELDTDVPDITSQISGLQTWIKNYVKSVFDQTQAGEIVSPTEYNWPTIGLARLGNYDGLDTYLEENRKYLANEENWETLTSGVKVTEFERMSLAIGAANGDPRNFAGKDLIAEIYNFRAVSYNGYPQFAQGTNGAIFALIALDSKKYEIPTAAVWSREKIITAILNNQMADGGFALSKTASGAMSDPDLTAMAIQALAPYQADATKPEVKTALDKAVAYLEVSQQSDGGYASASSESTSQVISALCSLGIDIDTDPRFIKTTNTLLSNLLSYRSEDGGFKHVKNSSSNSMASEQALLAFASYVRFNANQSILYDYGTESAKEVADRITSVSAPEVGATTLAMPTVPAGFTISIKTSSNQAVIATDGKITSPDEATSVNLVFTVIKTADSSTADTKSLSVTVPKGNSGGGDTTPPVITLKDSADQTLTEDLTVTNSSFSFKATAQDAKDGLLSPTVQLNGTALVAGTDGSYTCTLSMGGNTITVTATDAAGNKAEKILKVELGNPANLAYVNSTIDSSKKTVVLNFNKDIVNNKATPEQLKATVTYAVDGVSYTALNQADQVSITGKTLVVTFNTPLTGNSNKLKLAANSLKDAEGMVMSSEITTEALDAATVDECFIATAAYGSKYQPDVILLRQFRDHCLLTNPLGKAFVKSYYKNSPPIANFIAHSEGLKVLVRGMLTPLVVIAYLLLHPGIMCVVIAAVALAVVGLRRRRGNRVEVLSLTAK